MHTFLAVLLVAVVVLVLGVVFSAPIMARVKKVEADLDARISTLEAALKKKL